MSDLLEKLDRHGTTGRKAATLIRELYLEVLAAQGQAQDNYDRIKELEAERDEAVTQMIEAKVERDKALANLRAAKEYVQ